jgi:hypothetical protein
LKGKKITMNTLLTYINRYWHISALSILVAVSFLSLMPVGELPKLNSSDKLHHFIAYAAIVFPIALRHPANLIGLCLFVIGWSAVIELIQPYVNRSGEWLDLAANSIGVFCGWAAGHTIRFLISKQRK